MIYPNEKGVAIMGADGFIGKALSRVDLPRGVYFFDSPSSGVLFDENLDYCMEQTINDFLKVIQYCRDHDQYLVYPSSATVYNKNTNYAHCKSAIEEIAACYPMVRSLGLRIAAGYGPGESHKGRYASVVYQWCHQMMRGERPVIFGDGTQTRDFIFEDDIAKAISEIAFKRETGIYDIGTGINTSFNEIVSIINKCLNTDIEPIYVSKPTTYVDSTNLPGMIHDFRDITIKTGIEYILFGRPPYDNDQSI